MPHTDQQTRLLPSSLSHVHSLRASSSSPKCICQFQCLSIVKEWGYMCSVKIPWSQNKRDLINSDRRRQCAHQNVLPTETCKITHQMSPYLHPQLVGIASSFTKLASPITWPPSRWTKTQSHEKHLRMPRTVTAKMYWQNYCKCIYYGQVIARPINHCRLNPVVCKCQMPGDCGTIPVQGHWSTPPYGYLAITIVIIAIICL